MPKIKQKNINENIHLSIVAPAFNEQEGIRTVVEHWIDFCEKLTQRSEIIIVNDGSTDKTREILETMAAEHPCLRVISYDPNGGYGAALSNAISHSRGDWVLTIDADGQFEVEDYHSLWIAVQESGAACAAGIRQKHDSFIRVWADKILRLYGRLLFGHAVQDPNCALKLSRGDLLRSLTLESRGYSSPSEIFFQIAATGEPIVETHVNHLPRLAGESKLKLFAAGWNVVLFLLYLRIKIALHRRGVLYLFKMNRVPVGDSINMHSSVVRPMTRPLTRKRVRK
jgi:glycosyltransferase involved in cell wall biosynthesis